MIQSSYQRRFSFVLERYYLCFHFSSKKRRIFWVFFLRENLLPLVSHQQRERDDYVRSWQPKIIKLIHPPPESSKSNLAHYACIANRHTSTNSFKRSFHLYSKKLLFFMPIKRNVQKSYKIKIIVKRLVKR